MLQLKEMNKTNVKPRKRIKDNKWLGRLEPEKSGKTREEHFGRSEKKNAWLQFDENKQEMFCTVCSEFPTLVVVIIKMFNI